MNQLTQSSTPTRAAFTPRRRRLFAALLTTLLAAPMVAASIPTPTAQAAPVGEGFTISAADLDFILDQIVISEQHTAALACFEAAANNGPPCTPLALAAIHPSLENVAYDPVNDPNFCAALRAIIGSPLLSFGLREVDGSCNNLQPGQGKYGAADQTFPRLTTPTFDAAEAGTTYASTGANSAVIDSEPRTISNLIVDQTSSNPAAVAAAAFPVRTQGNEGVVPCTGPNTPAGCIPAYETLPIDNVTTDVGLSPPFNSLFTIFGQFFDHGLDKITNGGNGIVMVPLKADDPLIPGPDHQLGTTDDLAPNLRFMVLTRGHVVDGSDGFRNAPNTDTPFVDQSQTYTSHSSHQVFTREYVNNTAGKPVPTGRFLSTPDGGQPTWAQVKAQAAIMLGLRLTDYDVGNIPMIKADGYGNFIPGPNGLPQYVTATGLVEGNRANPVPVPANAFRIDTAFLNDIAHSAAPFTDQGVAKPADTDTTAGTSLADTVPAGSYDNELLDLHFICGDGRCNENIALTAVHEVFHMEHDRLVEEFKQTITNDTSGVLNVNDWKSALGAGGWNGKRLFQAARFVTEMEYQHLVFEEFARKVQPLINPFQAFAFNQTDVNPAITAEFAHAVYRFGHSMLDDNIPRINADGSHNDIPLLDGFLNPAAFDDANASGSVSLTSAQATGAIIMGLSDQTGQEIDEFVVETLRNNLLGLPLDLPALNMTRARSEGVPPLNNVRSQIFAATNDGQLRPYTDWVDFGENLKHPESLVNFVAAYGRHPLIMTLDPDGAGTLVAGSLATRRAAADQIVNGTTLPGPDGVLGDNPLTVINEALDDTVTQVTVCDPGTLLNPNTADQCGDDPATDLVDESSDDTITEQTICDPGATTNPNTADLCGDDPATFKNESLDDIAPPADSGDFMFHINSWANKETGLNDVDLWVGGLAERTNLFGGLLGTTFNYVFENQLTNLQNGDRLYYLARTPGMNLRAQLEGNSFAELVMRNTTAHTLKADPFATADCKFQLQNLQGLGTAGTTDGLKNLTGVGSVNDDPTSDCNENQLLIRMGDGTIKYRASNKIDPPGINGQGVYNGKNGTAVDRIYGGVDNDTFWGGAGNDIIEGGDGADVALGGEGDDIITDIAGDDVPKGGPGNDAIDAGPGLDIVMAGDGNDFTNGGANINETFAGAGDDFSIAGQGEDAIFGDSGDDWEEGGDQPDLLIGDSSTLFFDDHNLPGHDILIGQGGDDDYDGEGGDDIFVAGPGIEKNAGASGFDWSIGYLDPQPQDADLNLQILVGQPPVIETRDKFNELEALSGWNFDDVLRGDDVAPTAVGGGGFIGCDALDAAGVARIKGLDALVPTLIRTTDSATLVANSATRFCLLQGQAWGDGNILVGGLGSDTLEGRGADDILDGDRYMRVYLSVRDKADPGLEIATTDLMENRALTGSYGPGTTPTTTLQAAVFAGLVNPGQIVAMRELVEPTPGPTDVDVALFSGPQADYDITRNTNGSVTVAHTRGTAADGIDTLWNIEQFSFCQTPGAVAGTCAVRVLVDNIPPPPAPAVTALASLGLGTFAAQLGTTTGPETVVVTNTGNAALLISDVLLTGADAAAFGFTGDCVAGLSLAPLASCTINVTFSPIFTGASQAFIDIVHNADGGDTLLVLSGTGTAPAASVTPVAGLAGFLTAVGTQSAAQTATVTNTGDANLVVTGAALTGSDAGSFVITSNTCVAPVAPGASCTVSVALSPATAGVKAAQLVISHNAGADSVLPLSGSASAPIATITTAAGITAFTGTVGTTSAARAISVRNTGTANLTFTSVALTGTNPGDFTLTNGCVAAVAPGATCTINVAFRPVSAGTKAAQVVITHNAGAPSVVTVGGTATAVAPPTATMPNTVAFGARRVGQTRTQTVRITNQGPGALVIGTPTATGPFTVTRGNCPASLAAGRNCSLSVTFRPTARGAATGTLTVPSNATNSPHTAALTGTGT